MEGSLLPEGSGGEEPPEGSGVSPDERAAEVYNARMWLFEQCLSSHIIRKRRRGRRDYARKNCEEAWGNRGGQKPKADDGVG